MRAGSVVSAAEEPPGQAEDDGLEGDGGAQDVGGRPLAELGLQVLAGPLAVGGVAVAAAAAAAAGRVGPLVVGGRTSARRSSSAGDATDWGMSARRTSCRSSTSIVPDVLGSGATTAAKTAWVVSNRVGREAGPFGLERRQPTLQHRPGRRAAAERVEHREAAGGCGGRRRVGRLGGRLGGGLGGGLGGRLRRRVSVGEGLELGFEGGDLAVQAGGPLVVPVAGRTGSRSRPTGRPR